MQRTRLRAALLLVVAAALGGIGYLVSRSIRARRPASLRELSDFLPEVTQRIQNFRRVKMENGHPVWEVTARDAQYFQVDDQVVVHEPRITLYLDDGVRQCHVSGAEGRLTLSGHELDFLTLRGEVAVRLGDLELQTEEAVYDRARNRITSAAAVTLRGRALEVRGKGMEVDVGPQQLRLLEEVHTTLHAERPIS